MAEHDEIRALRDLGVGGERLAADLVGERRRALGDDIGARAPAGPTRARARGPCSRADEADLHAATLRRRPACQLWLKKPFSMSCARSSAEISTLRGVSMNTLSAIRCMPPSSA